MDIVYQDDHYVAINKPSGLLVHRTPLARARFFALQMLRNQVGRHVYPVHRLDRSTSGVLVFALSPEAARRLGDCFSQRTVRKIYYAVVRGYTDTEGVIDHPICSRQTKEIQEALTTFERKATVELDTQVGRYPTARYSLVKVQPRTGRMHQIRRHFAHIAHPVIGDTTHGDSHHNRFYRRQFKLQRLLLYAGSLGFTHPYTGLPINIKAPMDKAFLIVFKAFGWNDISVD
ncbi:MAG: pseudouridylate synthase [Deltaproteobacteria bacterium]|nr:pseudouridylate synthase [Deltaproteobacteria bacterium]